MVGAVIAKVAGKPRIKLKTTRKTGKALADSKTQKTVAKRAATRKKKQNELKKQKDMERKQNRAQTRAANKKKALAKRIQSATTAKSTPKPKGSPRMERAAKTLAKHKTKVAVAGAVGTGAFLASTVNRRGRPKKQETKASPSPESKTTVKTGQAFGAAFKEARKAGKKQFTWNGKKYHTRTKEEMAKKNVSKPKQSLASIKKPVKRSTEYSDRPDIRQQQAGPAPTRKKKVVYSGT